MAAKYMRFSATVIFDDKASVTFSWPSTQKRFAASMTVEELRTERRTMRRELERMMDLLLKHDGH